MRSLFAKLSLVFLAILLLLGFVTLWLANRSSQAYILEFTQKLNRPIAMYMAENVNWTVDGRLSPQSMEALAPHIVVINPSVEVFLLDNVGRVVWPVLSAGQEANSQYLSVTEASRPAPVVDMTAILRFLEQDSHYPLLGDHPVKSGERNIFSAWPIYADNSIGTSQSVNSEPLGYVYVVLAGEKYQTLLSSIKDSYSIRDMLITLMCVIALALFGGLAIFFMLTTRLRRLVREVQSDERIGSAWQLPVSGERELAGASIIGADIGDEIDVLKHTFDRITHQLVEQYRQLEQGDVNRREFVASISHDLRTPLTSLQNYLETVLAKWSSLDDCQSREYIGKAHKQTMRLQHLISQLFEISALNSPDLKLRPERFSMLELACDCVQDFQMQAQKKQIAINVEASLDKLSAYDVVADIAMIQRTLENLLANAIRHTPTGGTVTARLEAGEANVVRVQIDDTGCGLSAQQVDTFTRTGTVASGPVKALLSEAKGMARSGGSGLGLTIVQRILELHDSQLRLAEPITTSANEGTPNNIGASFYFILPVCLVR